MNLTIIERPSPNFTKGRKQKVEGVIIHCTDGFEPTDLQWLCNPEAKASAEYYIGRDGKIYRLVSEANTAWQAAEWNGKTIGIELSRRLTQPKRNAYTPVQYAALQCLLPDIESRHPDIWIKAHSALAPGRRSDPGPDFQWPLIAKEHWVTWGQDEWIWAVREGYLSPEGWGGPMTRGMMAVVAHRMQGA